MKITVYMAMTVNGLIAKPNDDTPWSTEEFDHYYKTACQFPAVILGRRTYDIMKDGPDFKKMGNPFLVVVSKKQQPSTPSVSFASTPRAALSILQQKGFSQGLLGGGGLVNSSFLKENLVDTLLIDIEPLIFGKGIPLFAPGGFEARLKFSGVKKISDQVVQLKYQVLHS